MATACELPRIKRHAGALLDDLDDIAILTDASSESFPVVGISIGFQRTTGYILADAVGRPPEHALTQGTPSFAVSRSSGQTLADYCRTCSRADLEFVSESTLLQVATRKDGTHYVSLSLVGLCEVRRRPYVLIVQEIVGEGMSVPLTASNRAVMTESLRAKLFRIRREVGQAQLTNLPASSFGTSESMSSASTCFLKHERLHTNFRGHRRHEVFEQLPFVLPSFAFFSKRLQEHCMLKDDLRTAMRREPEFLPRGCMNFSDRPVQFSQARLEFTVQVTGATPTFLGLPNLGFTRRKPEDHMDLYPEVAKCCGASVVGGSEGVSARDKYEHFRLGFKKPSPDEMELWSSGLAKEGLPKLQCGDILRCLYSAEGQFQIWLNKEKFIDADTHRRIDFSAEYYAVVDVCLSATSLTLISSEDLQDSLNAHTAQGRHRLLGVATSLPAKPAAHAQRLTTILSSGELPRLPQEGCTLSRTASSHESDDSEPEEGMSAIAESSGLGHTSGPAPDPADRSLTGFSILSGSSGRLESGAVPPDAAAVPDPPLQCDLQSQPRNSTEDFSWLMECNPEDTSGTSINLHDEALGETTSHHLLRRRGTLTVKLLVVSCLVFALIRRRL